MCPNENRLSAGVIVIRQTPAGVRFLLLRAYRYWDFPKGMVESGEDPITTARREVREETTLRNLDFAWGDIHYDTPPYARRKIARYFLARTTETQVQLPANPEIGRPEHMEYRWVDAGQARELISPRVEKALDWALATLGRDRKKHYIHSPNR